MVRCKKYALMAGLCVLMLGQQAHAAAHVVTSNGARDEADMRTAAADAFFIVGVHSTYPYKENDLIIGHCTRLDFFGEEKKCETFEAMAQKRGCKLVGIAVSPRGGEAVVYCKRLNKN